eukprot:scaffold47418_cov62-Phaeocystis_antarctica.AAC.4
MRHAVHMRCKCGARAVATHVERGDGHVGVALVVVLRRQLIVLAPVGDCAEEDHRGRGAVVGDEGADPPLEDAPAARACGAWGSGWDACGPLRPGCVGRPGRRRACEQQCEPRRAQAEYEREEGGLELLGREVADEVGGAVVQVDDRDEHAEGLARVARHQRDELARVDRRERHVHDGRPDLDPAVEGEEGDVHRLGDVEDRHREDRDGPRHTDDAQRLATEDGEDGSGDGGGEQYLDRTDLRYALDLGLGVEQRRKRDGRPDRGEEHEQRGGEHLAVETVGPVGQIVRLSPPQVLPHLHEWHEAEPLLRRLHRDTSVPRLRAHDQT